LIANGNSTVAGGAGEVMFGAGVGYAVLVHAPSTTTNSRIPDLRTSQSYGVRRGGGVSFRDGNDTPIVHWFVPRRYEHPFWNTSDLLEKKSFD
jgi:hypothetical protein